MKRSWQNSFIVAVILLWSSLPAFAQVKEWEVQDSTDVTQSAEFLSVIESTLEDYYRDYSSTERQTDSIIQAFGYDYEDVPEFSDSVYCERLKEMNKLSPFHLDCNTDVLKTIKFFAKSRRNFVSVVKGRSELYFNMFEEKLAKHDLPIELKYLAVIESGLRPTAKSRAGALGLWQFMYRTGKMYGMDQNSYIDERMNPELATEAACLYLKKLHGLYNDWNMALAAYNAGPGNVNKAIRRSGGKMTYWGIRPFLPRETQGYVPNFIAAAYLMTYHAEHNILPREAKIYDFEVDTVCIRDGLHMEVIDSLTQWSVEDIQYLNPVFKTTYIPHIERHECLTIPTKYLDNWIAMEDSIYKLDSIMYKAIETEQIAQQKSASPNSGNTITHVVTKGQTLGHIAGRYGTTVNNIMNWNNMRSTRLSIGQRLIIHTRGKPKSTTTASVKHEVKPAAATSSNANSKVHVVNKGDNLWQIARNNDTTVEAIMKLNPNVNHKDLKVGQRIIVR